MQQRRLYLPLSSITGSQAQILGLGRVLVSLALSTCFFSGYAEAAPTQTVAALSEADFFADVPIVLTATRLSQPINEAPAAMTIIDREMIKASGAREVADVFRLVPGFQVQHQHGHTPVITYHGMSDQYSRWLQVLVDGRTIYTPSVGGVEWSHIPLVLEEIERIEVTRGPNAASYGSNAFAATINIITKHAAETTGLFAGFTYGEPSHIRDGLLRYGNTTGDLDYRLTLGYMADDGFEERHDLKRVRLGRLRADYRSSAVDTWLFEGGFNNGPRGLDFGDPAEYPERTREKQVDYHFEQLRWTRELDGKQEVLIQYFHNHHEVDETDEYDLTAEEAQSLFGIPPAAYTSPIHLALYNSITTDRHDLEIQHTLVPNENWRIAWGGSVRQDQLHAPGIISSNTTDNIDLTRIFANSEWHMTTDTLLNTGAMWEKSELTGNSISPRLALQHQLTETTAIRAITSKATRIPTMVEYDGEITYHFSGALLPGPVSVPFLKSDAELTYETIKSREIGMNSQISAIGLALDVKLYRDFIENIIYFDASAGYGIPRNGEDVSLSGLEVQADYKPVADTRIIVGYALTKIDSNDTHEDYSETAPLRSYSLLLSKRFNKNINASLALYRNHDVEGLGDGNPLPIQNKVDCRLSFPFWSNGVSGAVTLVGQNITGDYIDWRSDNIAERTYYAKLTLEMH